MRVVRDQNHGMILVYEIVGLAGDTDPPTLVFEWGASSVRVTEYPEQWRLLRDEELIAIGVS